MAGSDASEGQAVWQPGEAEEDSRLCEGNRHLHLAYDEEEEVCLCVCVSVCLSLSLGSLRPTKKDKRKGHIHKSHLTSVHL